MIIKRFFAAAALLALSGAQALAAPTIAIRDTSSTATTRTYSVYAVPDPALFNVDTNGDSVMDSGSIGVEIGLTIDSGAVIGTPLQTAQFEDDQVAPVGNFGYNPFNNGAQVEGFAVTSSSVFAALGTSGSVATPNAHLLDGPAVIFTFTVNNSITTGSLAGWDEELSQLVGAKIAQAGQTYVVDGDWGVFGDADFDGDVDDNDFAAFALRYDSTGQFASPSDFDLDGDVDDNDFAAFALRYQLGVGPGALSTASIPEPGTVLLTMLGLVVAIGYRNLKV